MKHKFSPYTSTNKPQALQAAYLSNSKQLEANLKSSIEEC